MVLSYKPLLETLADKITEQTEDKVTEQEQRKFPFSPFGRLPCSVKRSAKPFNRAVKRPVSPSPPLQLRDVRRYDMACPRNASSIASCRQRLLNGCSRRGRLRLLLARHPSPSPSEFASRRERGTIRKRTTVLQTEKPGSDSLSLDNLTNSRYTVSVLRAHSSMAERPA